MAFWPLPAVPSLDQVFATIENRIAIQIMILRQKKQSSSSSKGEIFYQQGFCFDQDKNLEIWPDAAPPDLIYEA